MTDFHQLIPELSQWNEGRGISVEDWINVIGNFEHAIAYGRLFWPDFVEHDGCILIADGAEGFDVKKYETWLKHFRGDKTATEQMINHRHIVDYFPNASEPTKEQLIYFGGFLREVWGCKLQRDFPDCSVEVFFQYDEASDYWIGFEITVYQNR
jgi:hypothetical protein